MKYFKKTFINYFMTNWTGSTHHSVLLPGSSITQWLLAPRGSVRAVRVAPFPLEPSLPPAASDHTPPPRFITAHVTAARALRYYGDTSPYIKVRLDAHSCPCETSQGFLSAAAAAAAAAAGKGTAPTNASELLWSQPDHLCVHLQTEPSCWHMRGADHPLCRYVSISAWKHFEDCLWSAERY